MANAMNEMARQVSDQINRLENDAHHRRQFLADVAHELRSPVTTMETMAGALKDGLAEEPERRDFAVSALVTTSHRMRRLVQDLMEAVADPDRIAQVLDNIIENAISYAGKGAEVKVSLEDANPIRITISDTGKSIKAADMSYVLDPFYRADSARTPNDSHSGLGLSIACKLVEAHGGKLTISSEEGSGTTVVLLIPKKR